MRILLFYILLALQIESPSQQVTKSPSGDDANNSVTHGLSDSVTYYESQIRLADSLYKNYLPQYNFDEVKKAVAFFEESPSKDNSRNSPTQQLIDLLSHRLIDSDFLLAQAHYYHAVGLTELTTLSVLVSIT